MELLVVVTELVAEDDRLVRGPNKEKSSVISRRWLYYIPEPLASKGDVSKKSTVEFAQVASSDSADYIIHITDRTIAPQHLSSHRCRLLRPLVQTLKVSILQG